jgi:hypothetical protein
MSHQSLSFTFFLLAKAPSQSPSPSRLALLSSRFASTSSKQQTLKERLAALIPQEIENVCFNLPRFSPANPLLGQGNQSRARSKVLRTRGCRSLIWVSFPFRSFIASAHPSSSGMRGLPALIWDGSVLDAGSPLFLHPVFYSHLSRRRHSFSWQDHSGVPTTPSEGPRWQ